MSAEKVIAKSGRVKNLRRAHRRPNSAIRNQVAEEKPLASNDQVRFPPAAEVAIRPQILTVEPELWHLVSWLVDLFNQPDLAEMGVVVGREGRRWDVPQTVRRLIESGDLSLEPDQPSFRRAWQELLSFHDDMLSPERIQIDPEAN